MRTVILTEFLVFSWVNVFIFIVYSLLEVEHKHKIYAGNDDLQQYGN
jgi:hypothetical protein